MRVEEGYQPIPFPVWDPYRTDLILPALLKRLLPLEVLQAVEADLLHFTDEVLPRIKEASSQMEVPTLTQYDQWGRRIDKLNTSEGWRRMKDICIQEGLVAIAHERKHGEFSRMHGLTKSALMSGDSNVIMCPLSMTDGAARVLELHGTDEMKRLILPRLISRDPRTAMTSGQWMTEKAGGSDVSQTETVATTKQAGGATATEPGTTYELDGFKWFSSATDADMAVALARTGRTEEGSRGLSLFLVPMRFPFVQGFAGPSEGVASPNGINIHRLKNKLGTKIVPTAELSLTKSWGFQIGQLNAGVKTITPVLNITRMHSATGSISGLGRALSIARSYSTVRSAHGGRILLKDIPIHTNTLGKVGLLYRGLMVFLYGTIHLLGKDEIGKSSPEEQLRLRLSTPAIKGFAADKAVSGMEECMAALGGQGYMEENIVPHLIRDCLVEKIWEGTINILALDLVRAAGRPGLDAFDKWLKSIVSQVPSELLNALQSAVDGIHRAKDTLLWALSPPIQKLIPRPALMLFGSLSSAVYLLEHAIWCFDKKQVGWEVDVQCVKLWVEENLEGAVVDVRRSLIDPTETEKRISFDRSLLYGTKL